MSIYDALRDHLNSFGLREIQLTFGEIERIIARPLPASAERPQWWANTAAQGSTQRESWRAAGFDAFLIAGSKRVRFCRVASNGTKTERPARNSSVGASTSPAVFSEDSLKSAVKSWLELQGWAVDAAWGHDRGIDIHARRDDERWVIEAKGSGSLDPMRVNYFLGVLGETLQRMDDPKAEYSIALPDLKQFRNLWARLPALAKTRTKITALFVTTDGQVDHSVS